MVGDRGLARFALSVGPSTLEHSMSTTTHHFLMLSMETNVSTYSTTIPT